MSASWRRQRMGDANEDLVDQRRGQQQVTRAVEEEVQKAQEEVRKVEVELRNARRQFDIVDDQIDACVVGLDEVKLRDAKCVKLEQVKLRDATTNLISDWRTDWGSDWGWSIFKEHNKLLFRNRERLGTFTEFDWLSQDLPWLRRLQRLSNPSSTTRKERMYTHTPLRVEFWDVMKYIEDYVTNADKVKRKHSRIKDCISEFAQNSPIIATVVVASTCKFLGIKQSSSSLEPVMEPHLEMPFEPITEGGNSTNLDGSKNEDRDVRKCLFYANPPHLDLLVKSGGKGVAVFDFEDGDLKCPVPICKLWKTCSCCRTEMNPNCWCSDGIKKGHAESILNSFLQVYEHLVLAKVGYGVLTDNKHWYLVRRDHDGCFYISKCFNWRDTKPPLLAAIAYLVSSAVDNCNEFDVPPKKGERPWIWGLPLTPVPLAALKLTNTKAVLPNQMSTKMVVPNRIHQGLEGHAQI